MNGKTHLVIGVAVGMATAQAMNIPLQIGAAMGAVAALLPDIDHPQSYITSFIPFGFLVAKVIGGHRGITHSLVALAIGALAARPLVSDEYLLIFVAAYLSHLMADMCTADGVPLLLPIGFRFKILPGVILRYTSFVFEAGALIAALGVIVWVII